MITSTLTDVIFLGSIITLILVIRHDIKNCLNQSTNEDEDNEEIDKNKLSYFS